MRNMPDGNEVALRHYMKELDRDTRKIDRREQIEGGIQADYEHDAEKFIEAIFDNEFLAESFCEGKPNRLRPKTIEGERVRATAAAKALHSIWVDAQYPAKCAALNERELAIAAHMGDVMERRIEWETDDRLDSMDDA